MGHDEVRAKIRDILAGIVDDDALVLTDAMTARDAAWWDSLTHLRLLVAIESEFGVKFAIAELTAANNVGELVDLVAGKV